jgi:DNA ligase-associated metallophosphoesterase
VLVQPNPEIALQLMPERAVYWPRLQTLFVADLHLGRVFPPRTIGATLQRLQALVEQCLVRRIVFLGDLFHMRQRYHDEVVSPFCDWRMRSPDIDMWLVRGNHERAMGDPPPACRLQCVAPGTPLDQLLLLHEPRMTTQFAVCAHLHPCVLLPSQRAVAETAACFVWGAQYLVLPAFEDSVPGRVVARRFDEQYIAIRQHALVHLP